MLKVRSSILLKMNNNGLEEQTVKIVGFLLESSGSQREVWNVLAGVKEFIANKGINNGFKAISSRI